MSSSTSKAISLALSIVAAATVGCVPQVSRFRYLSFEEVPGISVESVAPVELENLVSGPTIPIRYSLVRENYKLLINIDAHSYLPNATIELANSNGYRLVTRPLRGMRIDRPTPCGSYNGISASGDRFEFSWIICGDTANPGELVVAFDVVAKGGEVMEEAIPFTLRKDGVYWLRDSL